MGQDNFGLKIGVEGEREFRQALSDINQTFKVLGSEMALATSQFEKNDKSIQAVTSRNAVLNKEIDAQKEKISTLKAALDNAASSFGENDRRTQNWQIQLNKAQAELNGMERELDESAEGADDLGEQITDSGENAEKAGGKFEKLGSILSGIGKAMGTVVVAAGAAAIKLGNPTACTAPSACTVSNTLSEGNVTLSWSGAAGGTNNSISSYEIQYSESSDNATWGAWTALTTVSTTATSGSASVVPSSTRGNYRRFQVRTRGAAGASYYSGWKITTNSVRRNTLPTAPTIVTATPVVYSTEVISLTWSGAAGGTSAIKGFTISSRTSTDNTTWSAWATLTTLTQTAGSGSYTPTVTRVIGTYTQFGISTIDALNVSSSVKASASILCSITACGLPTAFSLSATLTEGAVTLSWSGATHGAGNTITAYELQYSESTDASTWGAWTTLTVVSSTATSGSQSVSPSATAGTYRRFRLRIQGTAGETYYSAWLVSSNIVRRNIPPTAPTVFTASPAVYDAGLITLTWSGIVAGTSAIKQVVIQLATSADGVTWGAYEALTTITTSATSGTYEATPSGVSGISTRYRLSVTDTLNAISAYALSNVIHKVSPPTAPVVTAPKVASQTHTATPRFLITTGVRLGGGTQKVCVKIGTADWEDSVVSPERFSSSGYLANGVPTIYTPAALLPGSHTITFRSVDNGSEAVSPEVVRTFNVLASPFEDIIANATKVKAAHMRSLRTAINNVRDFYGLSAASWSEDVVAGKTHVKNWPFHVLELRKAIEQVVDAINGFDVTWANKLPDPVWIPISMGRPQAAVMQQLQTIILGL